MEANLGPWLLPKLLLLLLPATLGGQTELRELTFASGSSRRFSSVVVAGLAHQKGSTGGAV
jgi:hypothetical protein